MMFKRLVLILMVLFIIPNVIGSYVQAQTADFPPLTEPGPYGVRLKIMIFVDKSRGDWKLETAVLYPADKTKGTPIKPDSLLLNDAPPDKTGAPYPLIIYSHGWRSFSGELMNAKAQLASQGYVVVAPSHHDTNPPAHEFVDRSLDIQLALRELEAIKEGDLAGMIDTENIGLMGYSQGATASLQMLGLVSDPVRAKEWCNAHPEITTEDCHILLLKTLDSYRTQLGLANMPDGRWQPFGDERIHAVLAMAPCHFPLTTEDMLASVTTPVMILHGTSDASCDYEGNAVRNFTYLGSKDRYLITAVKGRHSAFGDPETSEHFATAFFGYYLKGDETYQPYLTPEHLPERLPAWSPFKLAWGVYEGE